MAGQTEWMDGHDRGAFTLPVAIFGGIGLEL
jgi:hypothetical protein